MTNLSQGYKVALILSCNNITKQEGELRNEAALWSGGTAAGTSVSFAGWQQGEETEAGMRFVF